MKDLKNKAQNNDYMQIVRERLRELFVDKALRQWLYPRSNLDLPPDIQRRGEDTALKEHYFDKIPGLRMDGDQVQLRLESLTAIKRMLEKSNYELAGVFEGIHPRQILEQFGPDILWWIGDSSVIFRKEEIESTIRHAGIDPKLLAAAHAIVLRFETENYTSDNVRAIYYLMNGLSNIVGMVELSNILTANTCREDLGRYSLETIVSINNCFDYGSQVALKLDDENIAKYELALDGFAGFLLMYNGKPTAITAFYPFMDSKRLVIMQMQGITSCVSDGYNHMPRLKKYVRATSPKGLFNLDWTKALVEICAEIARRMGFEKVGILSAEKNGWIKPTCRGEIVFPIERAQRIYDETAERMGFTAPGTDGIWLKSVAELTLPKSSSSHSLLHECNSPGRTEQPQDCI